jgi:hypothetical protein
MATRRSNDFPRTAAPASSSGRAARPGASAPTASDTGARPARRRATTSKDPPAAAKPAAPVRVSSDARRAMIAEAAYLRAERRGFGPGSEEEDWLSAEKEVDALLSAGQGGPQ